MGDVAEKKLRKKPIDPSDRALKVADKICEKLLLQYKSSTARMVARLITAEYEAESTGEDNEPSN